MANDMQKNMDNGKETGSLHMGLQGFSVIFTSTYKMGYDGHILGSTGFYSRVHGL